jgi:ABC-type bacteriocin/lantibiotic exporter with double-glycine peptidase domain
LVEVASLAYGYGGQALFDGLSLRIGRGGFSLVVGGNGSGKSTLLALLAGARRPDAGSIVWCEGAAGQLAYLPQDVFVFQDTLRNNILLGRDFSDRDIGALLRRLGWDDFLQAWPAGLDTEVAERGGDLSGGQRQRIGLLRALIGAPAVLLLDEPENNLDARALDGLVHYLAGIRRAASIVMVSHSGCFDHLADARIDLPGRQARRVASA